MEVKRATVVMMLGGGSQKGLERGRRGNLEAEVEDSRMVEVVAVGNSHQEGAGHIEVVEGRMDSFMKCGVGVIIVFCWGVNFYLF
jgi:hypothetical protein